MEQSQLGGLNSNGQCNIPAVLTNVKAIAAGEKHTVVLKEDGTVAAWGYNSQGQCSVPKVLTNVKAIAAGAEHTVALKEDGTVVAWGSNSSDQCSIPTGLTNVKAIAAGAEHTVALKEDGTVVAWGSNSSDQCSIPAGLIDVKAIDAMGSYTMVLKEDGTVAAWGFGYYGPHNIPSGLTSVKAIAAGEEHAIALLEDGTVVGFGGYGDKSFFMPSFLSFPANTNGIMPLPIQVTDSIINPTQPIIYFSDVTNKKLIEVNYETGSTREITFEFSPKSITFLDGKIYVSLLKGQNSFSSEKEDQRGAFAVVDADTFTKISQYNILTEPYDIATDNYGNVYISDDTDSIGYMRSYSQQGIQISSDRVNRDTIILVHPNSNKIYSVSKTSSTFIQTHNINNGVITNTNWENTFGQYDAKNACISPDGKYLFINFDRYTKVFSCNHEYSDDVALLGTIANRSKDMAFDLPNNRFFMCDGSNQIGVYNYDYMEKIGTIAAKNNVNNIFFKDGKLVAITSNITNQVYIEIIPSSSIVKLLSEENSDSYSVKLHGSIKDTVYSSVYGKKAFSIDSAYSHLLITDLDTCKVIKQVKLPYRPSGLCVFEDETKLYIANFDTNYPITELDIKTGLVLRNLKYKVYPDYSVSDGDRPEAHRHIYNRGGKLFLVGGEWGPKLYVFDAATFAFISSPIDQVGDLAFSTNNDCFYFWRQYGWDAGYTNSNLHKYSINGNTFTEVEKTSIDIMRNPINTPILLLNERDEVICKKYIFKQSDLTSLVRSFPEAIYAIDTNSNIAVGTTGFYDLRTGLKTQDSSFKGAKSFYFDQDGTLYYEKDNVLKVSKFMNLDINESQVSLGKDQTFQTVVTAVYSEGRNGIVTSQATFETSNADVAKVSANGLITGVNMGTADITVRYGNFVKVIKVDVRFGLKSITLSNGTLSPQFDPKIGYYNVTLPFGVKTVPQVTALAIDPITIRSINSASSLPGNTEITVLSSDGSFSCKYIISFSAAEYIESSHPYPDDANEIWEYTETDFNGNLRITFSEDTYFEYGHDYLTILDKDGNNISGNPFTGDSLAGKTITIKGNSFKIRLNSNGFLHFYGFRITDIVPVLPLGLYEISANAEQCSLNVQDSFKLKVDADLRDGSKKDITNSVNFSSIDTSIATVNQYGLITAVAPGYTYINMKYEDYSTNVRVVVTGGLSSIGLSSGTLSPEFNSKIYTYNVTLPFGTKEAPTVSATAKSPGENVVIIQGRANGCAIITVTEPDGFTTLTYTVNFYINKALESKHPYSCDFDYTWVYTDTNVSTSKLKLVFDPQTYVQTSSDYIYIMDSKGNEIQGSPFTGNSLAGKTVEVPGNTVKIRLKTDLFETGYGFKVNEIIADDSPNDLIGDFNGDKFVNSIDFAILRQYLLGMIKSFPVNDVLYVGDLNRDGEINSIDFAILRGYLLGDFKELPYVN